MLTRCILLTCIPTTGVSLIKSNIGRFFCPFAKLHVNGDELTEPMRRLVQELALAGYQLDRSAYDYLRTMNDSETTRFAKHLLLTIGERPSTNRILTKQQLLEITTSNTQIAPSVSITIPAKQIEPRLKC